MLSFTMNSLLPRAIQGLRTRWLLLILVPAVALFARRSLRLALEKNFAIDEFQYAHAAWLIARGQVPYRDFFEVHHPLTYQLLSLLWIVSDDDPRNILRLRVAMLGFLLLTCLAIWKLCALRGRTLALLGPLMLLSCLPFTVFATEIRNDPTAFAFFVSALAALHWTTLAGRWRALLSGAALALACWGTQKAFYYGSVFVAAFVADVTVHRKRAEGYLLADPIHFVLGAGAVVVPISVWLTNVGAWDDWWRWCFAWAAEYQLRYNGFSWWDGFVAYLWDHWWHLPLAAFGFVATLRRLLRDKGRAPHPDHLLLGALVTTFISVSVQEAPWPYSHVPFLGIMVVLAARGLIELVSAARAKEVSTGVAGTYAVLVVATALLFIFHRAGQKIDRRIIGKNNAYQLAVLADVNRLTDATDVAYDNSGSYVSRPHAYFYFYTDASTRNHERAMLNREVPVALVDREAVLVFRDERHTGLPEPLKSYLDANYQRYSGDLWLWGARFDGAGEHTFKAIKSGHYFLEPETVLVNGELSIDGVPVRDRIMHLRRGDHRLLYKGSVRFQLLWLPRDGKPWKPQPNANPKFSSIF